MKSTYFGLLAEFESGEVRLVDCCEKYFGYSEAEAKRKATQRALPIPAYRVTNSQKAPWLVSIADLAAHIDKQKAQEKPLHEAFNSDLRAAG